MLQSATELAMKQAAKHAFALAYPREIPPSVSTGDCSSPSEFFSRFRSTGNVKYDYQKPRRGGGGKKKKR